jgi:hypothetical protein
MPIGESQQFSRVAFFQGFMVTHSCSGGEVFGEWGRREDEEEGEREGQRQGKGGGEREGRGKESGRGGRR